MPVAQKLIAGLVAIGMATTLVLPRRETARVINAVKNLLVGVFGVVITGRAP